MSGTAWSFKETMYKGDHMNGPESKYRVVGHSELDQQDPVSLYYEYQDIAYPYETIGEFQLFGKEGMEAFLPLLPVEQLPICLNGKHGATPVSQLIRFGQAIGLTSLWVKHEELNPTGSFKDRESAVVLAVALEKGIDSVYVASSGNAAVSTAAYAQKARLACVCYVPEKTSIEKKALITLYGAGIV